MVLFKSEARIKVVWCVFVYMDHHQSGAQQELSNLAAAAADLMYILHGVILSSRR
jgi:hypothetical protein